MGGEEQELRRKLEQARRLTLVVSDHTTLQRLQQFADEISQKLQTYFGRHRAREEIRVRARQLWEENGRPAGRDTEFWLRAEREIENKIASAER